jgi:hypothetical protein
VWATSVRAQLVALVAVGCSFHPQLSSDSSIGDDDDAAMPGSDAAVFAAPTCGTPGSLQNNFDGSTLDPRWYPIMANATYAIANNAFTVTVNDNGAMSGVLLLALPFVNLSDGEFRVEVESPLPTPGATRVLLSGPDPMHYISMGIMGGTFQASVANGAAPTMGSAAYNLGSAYWWSVLDNDGELNVRISQDQTTWTNVITPIPTPSFVTAVRATLDVQGAMGSATFAQIDTAQGSAPWCDASTLHDTFATDAAWLNAVTDGMPPACTYMFGAAGGTVAPTKTATCYFGSTYDYNLDNSSFVVKWGSGSADATFVPLVAVTNAASYAEVFVDGTNATSFGTSWTGQTQSHTWNPAGSDAYWKVSESGGILTFANSATGSDGSWNTLATGADPFDLSAVEIGLGASATAMPMPGQQVMFFGVN